MSRIAFAGLGACVLIVLFWVLLVAAPPGPPAPDGKVADLPDGRALADGGASHADAVDADHDAPPAREAAPTPDADAAGAESAAELEYTVRVVHADGTPAAGASVSLLAQTDDEAEALRAEWLTFARAERGGVESFLRQRGTRYPTDGQGVARVPEPTVLPYIQADLDLHTGLTPPLREADGDEVTITLHERIPFDVHVVDAQGLAVPGAPVAVTMASVNGPRERALRFADENGTAHFDDLRLLAEQSAVDALSLTAAVLMAPGAAVPGQSVVLDEEVVAAGSCRVVAPPSGTLAVRVIDADGTSFAGSGTVSVRLRQPERRAPGPGVRSRVGWLQDGVATIPFVGLGQELQVSFHDPTTQARDVTECVGPAQAGEVHEVVLRCAARALLTGQLRLPDGEAVARARPDLQLSFEGGGWSGSSHTRVQTDDEGRFEHALDGNFRRAEVTEIEAACFWEDADGAAWQVTVPVPAPFPDSGHALGALTLQPRPILLSGSVLDADEQPVVQARVRVESKQQGGEGVFGNWRSRAWTQSDENGRFLLHGEAEAGQIYRVRVEADEAGSLVQAVGPGQKGVVLRLEAPARLLGELLVDPGVPLDALRVVIRVDEDRPPHLGMRSSTNHEGATLDRAADGESAVLRATLLPGKPHRLEITTAMHQTVFALDGILAAAGEEVRPPGLQPLDLRERLRNVVVTVRAADGTPPAWVGMATPRSDGRNLNTLRSHDGTLETLVLDALHDVHVFGHASQDVHLPVLDGDRDVTLAAGVTCTLTLPAHLVDRDDLVVTGTVTAEDRTLSLVASQSVRFDRNGHATVCLPRAPGRYLLRLVAQATQGDGRRRAIYPGSARAFDAPAAGAIIPLTLEQAFFDEMVAQLLDQD